VVSTGDNGDVESRSGINIVNPVLPTAVKKYGVVAKYSMCQKLYLSRFDDRSNLRSAHSIKFVIIQVLFFTSPIPHVMSYP
jgi:hypothetical protein